MNARLNFLKTSTALALGGILLPGLSNSALNIQSTKNPPAGLQLYTVDQLMQKGPKDTLQEIVAIGYK